ncbi:hypothetical protein OAP79_01795 [Candidatus Pelagibacter sp.]|nr:hypothetical protein [Candidatus Pelagibacter sp.]
MKKILAIIVFGFLLSGNANARSMISISEYIQKNPKNSKDPITQVYISKRCSAVNLYMFTLTQDKDPKTAESFVKSYEHLFNLSAKILVKYANLDFKTAGDQVTADVDGMMQYYIKDGQDYFLRTGSYIMDNYIGDDLRFCKKLMKKNK